MTAAYGGAWWVVWCRCRVWWWRGCLRRCPGEIGGVVFGSVGGWWAGEGCLLGEQVLESGGDVLVSLFCGGWCCIPGCSMVDVDGRVVTGEFGER